MSNIACVAVSLNIRGPFELCGIGMTSSYISGLELLELLLGTEFVCLQDVLGSRLEFGRALRRLKCVNRSRVDGDYGIDEIHR